VLLAGSALAQPALDESQYVERVLTASLEARVAELEAALGRAEAVGVGLWPNPALEWERQKTSSGTREGESQDVLMASIPLVLSGRLGLEAEAAERSAQSAEARHEWARAGLRHEATRAFTAVLAARERRSILEESLAALRSLAEAIAVREKAGATSGCASSWKRRRCGMHCAVPSWKSNRPRPGRCGCSGPGLRPSLPCKALSGWNGPCRRRPRSWPGSARDGVICVPSRWRPAAPRPHGARRAGA
jgi:Outer membrane efflux protein